MATTSDLDTYPMKVIEWHMLDKSRFYPMALTCSLTVRGLLYPLSVIKTRIQIQRQNTVYKGTFSALRHVYRTEGMRALYKGYWISTLHVGVGVVYVSVYELVRHTLKATDTVHDHSLRSLIAGGSASLICQTIAVPCDVVSQHMMILGTATSSTARVADPLNLTDKIRNLSTTNRLRVGGLGTMVVKEIYRRDGATGFYRGYLSSLMLYVPNSAVFWYSYHKYCQMVSNVTNDSFGQLQTQAMSAPIAGCTTALLTNPSDLFRARIQVQRATYLETARRLWAEERMGIFHKGLSARLVSSCIFSIMTIVGYESLKRLSVQADYAEHVKW